MGTVTKAKQQQEKRSGYIIPRILQTRKARLLGSVTRNANGWTRYPKRNTTFPHYTTCCYVLQSITNSPTFWPDNQPESENNSKQYLGGDTTIVENLVSEFQKSTISITVFGKGSTKFDQLLLVL